MIYDTGSSAFYISWQSLKTIAQPDLELIGVA